MGRLGWTPLIFLRAVGTLYIRFYKIDSETSRRLRENATDDRALAEKREEERGANVPRGEMMADGCCRVIGVHLVGTAGEIRRRRRLHHSAIF